MGNNEPRRVAEAGAGSRPAKADFDALGLARAKSTKRRGLAKRELCRSFEGAFQRETRRHDVRIVATGCVGPGPKRMIAVATPVSASRRHVLPLDQSLPPPALHGLLEAKPDRAALRVAEDIPS